ncbi:MAG: M23 family metallopeptidase [Deltaproteobacteria bacterium]|nr:M23 family metallopeptidase [Deltaproteobacteria bacterium]
MRRWLILLATVAIAFFAWVKLDPSRPTAGVRRPLRYLGGQAQIQLDVADRGTGLTSVDVFIEAAGTRYQLAAERYPAIGWRGSGVLQRSFDLPVAPRDAKIPEGAATLLVIARDGSWLNYLRSTPPTLAQAVEVDYTPPLIEVLTGQHYMRLGGSDVVVYKVSKDAVRSGVQVEGYFFAGTPGALRDPGVSVALFAVPQDLTTAARPRVVAEDAAGNRREAAFFVAVKPRKFAERTLDVGDDFLARKVPELLETNRMPRTDDLVAGYLAINRDLRRQSEETVREVCSRSEPKPLWSEVFLRQPDSAPLSSFADRRSYKHDGNLIDSQTHLGFDLASLRLSPVVAENTGKVVFTDNLGIYGNTVILDHGMGLFSLYGHLSSISVPVGQLVNRGDPLGRTGETGLAAGDHLHFSVMVDGVHVDPVEWWDPKWVADHVTEKLKSFDSPAAEPAKPASAAAPSGRRSR